VGIVFIRRETSGAPIMAARAMLFLYPFFHY